MTTATPPVHTIRHYQIIDRLGAGGMGVVYKAEDTKLGRTVALKFLPQETTTDEEAKQRFFVEAKAAARLDHPNICTVYEVGESEEGQLYIAMAFYEGETLDRRLTRGPFPVAQAVELTRQVAEGLALAHAAGIVHRDIKPGNIIVTTSGIAKVLDFGLAKLADVSMTRSRTTVGTAAYMAPEQIEGKKVTAATDVWALGVVFFELLTGRRPFGGDYEQAILYSILNSPAPLMRDLRPDIPLQLEPLVQKMLAKDPRERFASMAELLQELSAGGTEETRGLADEEPRFTPGSIVAGRYRIVALLGEGGMGAVYRADDLKLGQKVALKYIPRQITDDATTFERICNEVRIGRQLSHPNVCRVFDIVEAGSHRFIAMEFIEGEDLASLLRRIGTLPRDKALAVIRDVASGLAAAHDRGFVHRDLKPANIMIDGEGRARITDFGLAAAVESLAGDREVAGTPAYMAPEQLGRGDVTSRSDIYALGLVMFELLSGKRFFDGRTVDEIRHQHLSSRRRPSSVTKTIEPAVERIIAKCTEENPADRYQSLHAVIAALPGGDALEAAIAAGETPSPGMVAAASVVGDLPVARAWTLLIATALLLLTFTWLSDRTSLSGLVPDIRSHDALAVRCREVAIAFGHDTPRFIRYVTYSPNAPYLAWLANTAKGNWDRLRSAPPSAFRCMFRTSPVRFTPSNIVGGMMPSDPPETIPGMETIQFDHEGRLVSYQRVPEPFAPAKNVDWRAVFAQADLDPSRFSPVTPSWPPTYGFDARAAWTGTHTKAPWLKLRVEAATLAGRVVFFRVFEPWDRPPVVPKRKFYGSDGVGLMSLGAIIFLAIFARQNFVRGRSDVRGATRLAVFLVIAGTLATASVAVPVLMPRSMNSLAMRLVGGALFSALYCWVAYIAIEPFIRRRWPQILVSWNRLLNGQFRDPLIGRDILIGMSLAGAVVSLRQGVMWLLNLRGWSVMVPLNLFTTGSLDTSTGFIYALLDPVLTGIVWTLAWLGSLVLLRLLLRRDLAAVLSLAVILAAIAQTAPNAASRLTSLVMMPLCAWLLYRVGLVAQISFLTLWKALVTSPVTLDFSQWFAIRSTLLLGAFVILAGWAFYISLAGKPLFGSAMEVEQPANS